MLFYLLPQLAGVAPILGVLNVFFRDVGQFFTILLQFWFGFTPIVYPASTLPEGVREWLVWNPMAAVIAAYQGIFVAHTLPHWGSLLPVALLSLVLCAAGMQLFRKRAGEMVDEL